jgi:hypothetical protein
MTQNNPQSPALKAKNQSPTASEPDFDGHWFESSQARFAPFFATPGGRILGWMSESIQSGALRASSFDRPEGASWDGRWASIQSGALRVSLNHRPEGGNWAGNFLRKVRFFSR